MGRGKYNSEEQKKGCKVDLKVEFTRAYFFQVALEIM